MVESILVYSFMMFFSFAVGRKIYSKKDITLIVLIISLFVFVTAVRYGVGVDFFSYKAIYENLVVSGDVKREDFEVGFLLMMKILSGLGLSSPFFFGVCGLLQIGAIFFAFKEESFLYKFLIVFLVASGEYFSWTNGIRQITAYTFIVCAMSLYLLNSKRWSYLLLALAVSFHTSALLFFPFFFVAVYYPKIWIKSTYKKLTILALCYIFCSTFHLSDYINSVNSIMNVVGYERYKDASLIEEERVLEYGPRFFVTLISSVIIIANSAKMSRYYDSKLFNALFNIFFIGTCLLPLFRDNMHLMRFLYYFNSNIFILQSYYCHYLYARGKKQEALLWFIFISIYLLVNLFTATKNSNILYQNIFEID